jgi:hypothetical protein
MLPAAPFTQMGEKTNLLAAHYLRYAMPTSKVQSVWEPRLVECKRIYNGEPEGFYRKPVGGGMMVKEDK